MAPQEVSQQDVTIHQDYFYQMTEFLTDWHVRVTWVAFTVLWLLWAISWTLRHMFGGDAAATNYVDNTNATNTTATAAAANAPVAGTTDPETGAPGATTTTTNPNNPGGKLGFLGSPPAWGQNVYVSFTLCIFFLLQYPLIRIYTIIRTVWTVLTTFFAILSSCSCLSWLSILLLVALRVVSWSLLGCKFC